MNKLYTKYKYNQYCHYDEPNKFKFIEHISNYNEYSIVQLLYNSKTNATIFYNYIHKTYFLTDETKKIYYRIFIEYQNFKRIMSTFILCVKFKIKKKYNSYNLIYNDFKKDCLSIIENDVIYTFDNFEIYKMCKNGLIYIEYNIIKILDIKNPYTNLSFSLHNLYNIYFYLISYNMPKIFLMYFKENFNKKSLIKKYKDFVIIEFLEQKYNTLSYEEKNIYINNMLELNYRYKHIINLSDNKLYTLFYKCCKYYYIYYKLYDFITNNSVSVYIKQYYRNKFMTRLEYVEKKAPLLGRTIKNYKLNTERFIDDISNI